MATKLEKWMLLSSSLKRIKDEEMTLRREICEEIFAGEVGEFRKKAEYDGRTVTAISTVNRSVDKAVLSSIWEDLSEAEQDAINFKPEISVSKYKKLEGKLLLNEAITVKPGAPTLEVKD
jgi:hypothetical protein